MGKKISDSLELKETKNTEVAEITVKEQDNIDSLYKSRAMQLIGDPTTTGIEQDRQDAPQ
jgi:hypothetical protein